jgi:histidyl-tRNA synthetase
VVIIGSEELQRGVATVKNMLTGEQSECALDTLHEQF